MLTFGYNLRIYQAQLKMLSCNILRFDMGIKAMNRQLATLHMIRPKLEHSDLEHVSKDVLSP